METSREERADTVKGGMTDRRWIVTLSIGTVWFVRGHGLLMMCGVRVYVRVITPLPVRCTLTIK